MKLSTLPSLTALLLALTLAACTKPNPAVCCLDAADCDEVGIPEVRGCSQGLACVDHQCTVPSCAEAGCGAEAPVCNVVTDVCDPCVDAGDCDRFADTPVCGGTGSCVQCVVAADCAGREPAVVCETVSSTCVQCIASQDCSGSSPVCDSSFCRACRSDDECSTHACGEDGSCVDEAAIVFLDPGGTDAGTCTRAAPCRKFNYAFSKLTATRQHIVLAPGSYVENGLVEIEGQGTSAPAVHVHGNGAVYTSSGDAGFIAGIPMQMHDLDFYIPSSNGLRLDAPDTVIERVRILESGYYGFNINGTAVLRDVEVNGGNYGIRAAGSMTLDRAIIRMSGTSAILADSGGNVNITNLLTYGSSQLALDLVYASGTIAFSTIVDSGAATPGTTVPSTVACNGSITIRSTIIWSGSTGRVPVQGCNLASTIAGPAATPGATNTNPVFVDASQRDYHLSSGSPARDLVDIGPTTDYEGEARPQGARFDIGADEAMP